LRFVVVWDEWTGKHWLRRRSDPMADSLAIDFSYDLEDIGCCRNICLEETIQVSKNED
jgi:hypothetical protein